MSEPISSDPALATAEQWQPGDIVLAADGALWCRADPDDEAQGWPWGYVPGHAPDAARDHPPPEGSVDEQTPVRPLTLLVRDGRPCTPGHDWTGVYERVDREIRTEVGRLLRDDLTADDAHRIAQLVVRALRVR